MTVNKFLKVVVVVLVTVVMFGCGNDPVLSYPTLTPVPTPIPTTTPIPEPIPIPISGIDTPITIYNFFNNFEIQITKVTITEKYVQGIYSVMPGGDSDILIMVEGKLIKGDLDIICDLKYDTWLHWTADGEKDYILCGLCLTSESTDSFIFGFAANRDSTDWEIKLPGENILLWRFMPFQEFVP